MTGLIGHTFGNYRIEALLGTGGMGEVYRGAHVLLDWPGAIKVMHAHLATDPAFQARFRQEARAVAALHHPNIVEMRDFGEQDGRFYLVLELVTGGSLRILMKEGPSGQQQLSLPVMLELVRQAAVGLDYAHKKGMVHRDIKPDNLLLLREDLAAPDDVPTLKISDFGLARLAQSGIMTVTGVTMGTPAYMSPEQFKGGKLDGRSDLYSLGVVLYEGATGRLPFEVSTISDAGYKHVHEEPPTPHEINPALPAELETVILRCLEKRPENRYATAHDLVDDLDAVLKALDSAGQTVLENTDQKTRLDNINQATARATPTKQEPAQTKTPPATTSSRVPPDGAVMQQPTNTAATPVVPTPQPAGPSLPQAVALPAQAPPAPPIAPQVTPDSGAVHVSLQPETLTITPGQPAMVKVILTNMGTLVDHFEVAVEGVPEAWVQRPGMVELLPAHRAPGNQATVDLVITVARSANNHAKPYPVTIKAHSPYTNASGSAPAVWTVEPFFTSSLALAPVRKSGRRRASYKLTLHNGGNAEVRYGLAAIDDEQKLDFKLDSATVRLPPGTSPAGTSVDASLMVQAPWYWIGRAQERAFRVSITSIDQDPPFIGKIPKLDTLSASGHFVHRALLPRWAPVIPVVLIALFILLLKLLPSVSLSTGTLSFGQQEVATLSPPQTVTLTNPGTADLKVSEIIVTGADSEDFHKADNCGMPVPPNSSCSIKIRFDPRATGPRSALLTISDNAFHNRRQSVVLTGTGIAPVAIFSPTDLHFGSDLVGTRSLPRTVTLTNAGTADLKVSTAVTGTNRQDFNIIPDACLSKSIVPHGACSFHVQFTPKAIRLRRAFLMITDTVLHQSQRLPLSGIGTAPLAILSATHLHLGSHVVGTGSPPQTVILTNQGTANLRIRDITLSGDTKDFSIVGDTCYNKSYAPGKNCIIRIRFNPQARGPHRARLIITDNVPNNLRETVALSGTGEAPEISLGFESSQDFGDQPQGSAMRQKVTLRNIGNAPLVVRSITITGPDKNDFPVKYSTCINIAPGSTCYIHISFAPQAIGLRRAILTIADNAPGSPQMWRLNGYGSAAPTRTPAPSPTATPVVPTKTPVPPPPTSVRMQVPPPRAPPPTATHTTVPSPTHAPTATSQTPTHTPTPQPPTLSPSQVNFLDQTVHTTSGLQTITLTNMGPTYLTFRRPSYIDGRDYKDFSIADDQCYRQTTIVTGESCTISISFTPTAIAERSASLYIPDSAGTQSVPLFGIGQPE